MKKTIVYALILSVVSVAAGLVAGVAIERAKVRKHLEAIRQQHPFLMETRRPQQHKAEGAPKEIFQKLSQDLNLDPQQEQAVKEALEKAREDILAVTKESRERLLTVRKESNDRIMQVLSPEQQERFKKIVAEAEKNHPRMLKKLGGRLEEEPPEPPETF